MRPSLVHGVVSHRILGVLGLLAVGCVNEDNFPERYADVVCQRTEECSGVEQGDACRATAELLGEVLVAACDDYKPGAAYRCLQQIEKQSCSAFEAEDETPACEKLADECGDAAARAGAEHAK